MAKRTSGTLQPIPSGCDKESKLPAFRCFRDARSLSIRQLHCLSTLNAERFYRASGFDTVKEIDVPVETNLTLPVILMGRELA